MSKVIEATQKCDPINTKTWLQFCRDMHAIDKLYHFEDDPGEMVVIKTGERTFTDEEVLALREFMERIFSRISDPMQAAWLVSSEENEED